MTNVINFTSCDEKCTKFYVYRWTRIVIDLTELRLKKIQKKFKAKICCLLFFGFAFWIHRLFCIQQVPNFSSFSYEEIKQHQNISRDTLIFERAFGETNFCLKLGKPLLFSRIFFLTFNPSPTISIIFRTPLIISGKSSRQTFFQTDSLHNLLALTNDSLSWPTVVNLLRRKLIQFGEFTAAACRCQVISPSGLTICLADIYRLAPENLGVLSYKTIRKSLHTSVCTADPLFSVHPCLIMSCYKVYTRLECSSVSD